MACLRHLQATKLGTVSDSCRFTPAACLPVKLTPGQPASSHPCGPGAPESHLDMRYTAAVHTHTYTDPRALRDPYYRARPLPAYGPGSILSANARAGPTKLYAVISLAGPEHVGQS